MDDIVRGCQKKKYRYQKKLYDRYSSLLYAICVRYLKNLDDANDALQEGFIKIYEKIDNYRGDGSFEGWMKRVQVNVCLMHLRKKKNNIVLEEEQLEELQYTEQLDDEDDFIKFPPEKLFKLIKGLSEGYRAVFNMYVLDGYTHKEIAEKLSISEGTSKSQLARAKKILKQEILLNVHE